MISVPWNRNNLNKTEQELLMAGETNSIFDSDEEIIRNQSKLYNKNFEFFECGNDSIENP